MFSSKDIFLGKGGATGYQISRSVRLRSSASANLNRTYSGTGTSATIKTLSMWVKRGSLGSIVRLANSNAATATTTYLQFDAADTLTFNFQGASTTLLTTTQVFRDPSAWYHIVLAIDTTQATSSNRVKIYVNGAQVTSFGASNYPALNATTNLFGHASANNRIGSIYDATANFFDGYLTEVNFIDGQALTPSSFGATNTTTGVWGPTAYTGTYGTNGFYLNFSDNSNNTAATIGKDYSGNGNNWTPNNISVTAGVTYDSMLDVPTPYADGGNGRGNYAVMNPLSVVSPTTIANGNLDVTTGTTGGGGAFSTIAIPTSGKYYFEFLPTSATTVADNIRVGVSNSTVGSYVLYKSDGNKVVDGSTTSYGATFTTNDTIGCAVDVDGGTITFYKNNSSQGSITYATSSGNFFAYTQDGSGTVSVVASFNFGQRPFTYTPPTGFKALNTQNLPDATIKNGASYMAATTYTGTGSALTIANTVGSASFQPDFVWVKGRSGATDHALYDSVRGTTKDLASNLTAAETTQSTGLTAFGSTGFTVGALAKMNTNAATYVGWQWLAGAGSSSSNTSGSITSTVSVNATAGFSVVTWTFSTSATNTIGHGLGVAPSFIIVKDRSAAVNWDVYHVSLGYTQRLILNSTGGAVAGYFAAAPTSTVFSMTTAAYTNNDNIVAYCFAPIAGYSAFGSYTGNGSADGPFVYLGFRPRFVLIKNTTSGSGYDWEIYDTSRGAYNLDNQVLYPDLSNAEATPAAAGIDVLSNGFKIRFANGNNNPSGATMIYAAFAENPLKYSLAR